jgi:hypothetical protein
MRQTFLLMTILAGATCLSAQQPNPRWVPTVPKSKPIHKPIPISAYNFRWTTYDNGWAELSFALRNNTKTDVKNVKLRVIFFGRDGEPIHYQEAEVLETIPTGLAVQKTINVMEGGLNLFHSTAQTKVKILSFDEVKAHEPSQERSGQG